MKKSLKILLIVAASFLLVVAFYGYHLFRAISLDPGVYLSGDGSGGPESALSMLSFSQNLPKGIVCGTLPSHLRAEYLEPLDYLETGAAAEYFFKTYGINEKCIESKFSQRYEKDSLEGELRSKWGEGTVITRYVKEDSCFRISKEIKAEAADSVVSLKTDLSGDSSLYVSKRKNGIVTECVACKWHDGRCDEVISEDKMELDPVSGKLLGYASKTRETYVEGSLYVGNEFYADKMLFDSLQRLVEYEYGDRVFHYEYSSNDTTNYSVNILDKSGRKVGFYKRKLKENRETVRYGTDRYEEEINRYFENGKLTKETSKKFDFYKSVMSRVKLFNPAGDEVLDSTFYEETFLPGLRMDSYAGIIKREYGENGKLKNYVQFEERFVRPFPFIFFPPLSESRKEVIRFVFAYDDAGQLLSITDESEDENWALRAGLPAVRRVVFSKGKFENFEECKEPYDPLKRLKPKRRASKQE